MRLTNQKKRSFAIAWMLAGLAGVFYAITIVKFGEQLDRAHADRRIDLAACLEEAPPLEQAAPLLSPRPQAREGARSHTGASCGSPVCDPSRACRE